MKRRLVLPSLFAPWLAHAQDQRLDRLLPSSPVDAVALYVIPTDGMPEDIAAGVARALTKDTGLWVKASLWAPSGIKEPMAGTNQYPAEDYFALGASMSRQLQDAGPRTYFIVLTERDINSRSRNLRFLFASHSPMARTSVLSAARLVYQQDGTPAPLELVAARMQKMLMRIVGEMKFGWQRSSDPADLMFAPIMSLDDIDRMSLAHTLSVRGRPR